VIGETLHLPNGIRYVVDYGAGRVSTVFPDGARCAGDARATEEDVARARALGYTGSYAEAAWAMHRDHDLLHTLVSQAEGWPWSPTLHAAAHGYELPKGMIPREERLVFIVQRALNLASARELIP